MCGEYVQVMTEMEGESTHRVVYMDESYIHRNFFLHKDYLFDPNDDQDLKTKTMQKGRQY